MDPKTQLIFEWIKMCGLLITAVGVCLAYHQFRAAVRWNKLNASFSFLSSDTLMGRERAAADAMLPLGVDLHYTTTPLDSKTVAAIFNDTKVFREVKELLNVF